MAKEKESKEPEKIKTKEHEKGKGLRVFLGILLVLSLITTVLGYDLYRVLFDTEKVKDLLYTEIKDSNLVPAVLEYYSVERAKERVEKGEALSGVSEPDIPLLMSFMELEDWRAMKINLVSDELITHLVSVTVDGLYAWIDSNEAAPQITWRMTPLKEALVGQPGIDSIMIGNESLPECTQKQLADFTMRLAASPPGVEVLYNLCRFPPPWKDDQIEDYNNALINVNDNIPDEFVFSDMLQKNPIAASTLMPLLRNLLQTIRWIGQWGWAVSLALIALLVLICLKPMLKLSKGLGVPLTVAGGILLVSYLLGLGLLEKWLIGLILSQTSDVVKQEVAASLTHLSSQIFQPLLWQTLLILAAGIALLVVLPRLKKELIKA